MAITERDIALRDKLRTLVSEHKLQLIACQLEQRSRYITFVCEHFYHDHNIHAAMRSIESCGFQDISIIDNQKIASSNLTITQGAESWLTMHQYAYAQESTKICFEELKAQGYRLVGASPHNQAYTLAELPIDQKTAIILGNERIGLSEYALAHIDTFVTIPMYGFTESFNASVSAAIIAYELRERLQNSQYVWGMTAREKFDLELEWLRRLVRGSEHIEKEFFS